MSILDCGLSMLPSALRDDDSSSNWQQQRYGTNMPRPQDSWVQPPDNIRSTPFVHWAHTSAGGTGPPLAGGAASSRGSRDADDTPGCRPALAAGGGSSTHSQPQMHPLAHVLEGLQYPAWQLLPGAGTLVSS
jgi:hypothetical protein